ncbi:MAG TPA: MBL fold metallo-hydrolase [Candidatus Saccharimonadales bacterium]|nr:MBL fold metallo-hydrolase [Candidatus Saccharimonadales bacterium]
MIFKQVPVGTFQNFAYIIGDEKTKLCAIVDPAWEVDKLLSQCKELGLSVSYVINTHSHHDHVEGNDAVVKQTGAKIVAQEKSRLHKDIQVKDGDPISIGSLKIRVIHTPGHCPDHICLLVDGNLMTGDTLFVGECGRTDLEGGSASEMYESLFNKLMVLGDSIKVHPGHDYGNRPSSSIGEERKNNYTLRPRTKEEFIKFMAQP